MYLALIASEEGDASKAEFYGAQSVSFAADMAKCTKNSAALGIEITACALVCELCLAVKNKPKAAEYAEMGLEACSVLAGIDPQNDRLELRELPENTGRKPSENFSDADGRAQYPYLFATESEPDKNNIGEHSEKRNKVP